MLFSLHRAWSRLLVYLLILLYFKYLCFFLFGYRINKVMHMKFLPKSTFVVKAYQRLIWDMHYLYLYTYIIVYGHLHYHCYIVSLHQQHCSKHCGLFLRISISSMICVCLCLLSVGLLVTNQNTVCGLGGLVWHQRTMCMSCCGNCNDSLHWRRAPDSSTIFASWHPYVCTTIYYMVPWAHVSLPSKWHLDWLRCFCWAHPCDQHTDSHTDRHADHATSWRVGMAYIWHRLHYWCCSW